jgi:hypothetical protein
MNIERLRKIRIHFPPRMYECSECKGTVWTWNDDMMREHQKRCSPKSGWMA